MNFFDSDKDMFAECVEDLIVDQFAKMIAQLFVMFPDFNDKTKNKILTIIIGFLIFTQAKERKEIEHLGTGQSKESQELVKKILQFINSELGK